MDGREIPGFYFDPEKKKYFQIQKSYQLPPNAKYSAANVKKEQKRQRIEEQAVVRTKKRQKETITRRHVRASLMYAGLDREVGLMPNSLMRRTWPGACVSGLPSTPEKVVDRPESTTIRFFDRDSATNTLYAVHGDNKVKRLRLIPSASISSSPREHHPVDSSSHATPNDPLRYMFEPWDELARLTSPISSLQFLPESGALAATTYGSDRPPVVYLSDPDQDGPYVAQQFTLSANAIWGAAVRPAASSWTSAKSSNSVAATDSENLAVATSNSLLMFTRSQAGSWDSSSVFRSDSDVLSIDWLSPRVVVMGCRNGKIHLFDTRANGSSHILTHSSPITSLKRADDETRLVCAGLQDTLSLYDIRASRRSHSSTFKTSDRHYNEQYFENLYPGHECRRKRRKMEQAAFKNWSQPILTFEHSNVDELTLPMDVHPRLGLIAAAQGSSTTAVRIHNIWTGMVVKENNSPIMMRMRTLKFMEDEQDGGVSLWANCDGGIARLKW